MSDTIHNQYPWASIDQVWCIQFIWDCLGGPHHCYGKIEACGKGVRYIGSDFRLATFDFSGLTYLVFEAHKRAIRVEIRPRSRMNLELTFFKRIREGAWHERHPTLDEAIEEYRKYAK